MTWSSSDVIDNENERSTAIETVSRDVFEGDTKQLRMPSFSRETKD